ncbi:NAD-P-binding protein [Stereum hirsutum FP-91666 SS1]|uniref:NAD-P-binding protein n=1 Tax=Stereum hirsutum (strain FP-91666) TaxID=721885 RepID=UPI000440B22E|nr:NAD-P-binding protein [Stereum hirsutum FP-91666 SS1]EIM86458.1 NAD-P-binding protein [Stereum hirsutum FP-91666 SS1]
MSSTKPRVAFVTGVAARGIGRSIALQLAKDGMSVAINDIPSRKEELTDIEEEIRELYRSGTGGQNCIIAVGDVSSEEDVKRMVEEVVDQLGSLDVMVANAGIFPPVKTFVDTSVDTFDRIMSVNARGIFLCYQHAARQMIKQRRGGRIIGASSLAGKQGMPMGSTYTASKFAVRGLTQAVALDLGKHGITVNAYAPGCVDTDMTQTVANEIGDPSIFINTEESAAALGRIGKSNEVAALVSFLASEDSSFITGQIISVDGGRNTG